MKHFKKISCGLFALTALASVTVSLTACSKNPFDGYEVGQDISFNSKKQADNAKQFAIEHIYVASSGTNIKDADLFKFLTNGKTTADWAGAQIYSEILYYIANTYTKNNTNQIRTFTSDNKFNFSINDDASTITNTATLTVNYNGTGYSMLANEYKFQYAWVDNNFEFQAINSNGDISLHFASYALKGATRSA